MKKGLLIGTILFITGIFLSAQVAVLPPYAIVLGQKGPLQSPGIITGKNQHLSCQSSLQACLATPSFNSGLPSMKVALASIKIKGRNPTHNKH